MQVNDIEIITAQIISEENFKSKLYVYWVDKTINQFYHYNGFVSSELFQDLSAGSTQIEWIMIDNLKDCEKVSHQEMIEKFHGNEIIKKYITAYIRDEKLNKLI